MFSDSDFKSKLISDDIISWNGVITRYGAVKEFIKSGDMIRMADEEERDYYASTNSWYNMRSVRGKLLNRIKGLISKVAIKPTHFKIVRACESVAIKYIPQEWIRDTHLDAFVIEFYAAGRQVAISWVGSEFFELPIHTELPIEELLNQ
jgi:hypothetical protein